jgi:hypothetical protein
MFKTSETTLGSAVADNGTFTLSYPEATSAGTFSAYGHKMWVDKFQRLLSSPSDFTVSFGASNITVTYLGSTTIPAGARVNVQLDIDGADDGSILTSLDESMVKRTVLANVKEIRLGSPDTADADGFCVSQDLTSAGVFSVSTTAAAAIAAAALAGTADVPRNVVAAWTGTAVLTITGTDEYGETVVESSASGTSLTGKKAFKTVTDISSSANITSLTVGTGDVIGLPSFLSDEARILAVKEGTTYYDKASKYVLNADSPTLADAGQVYCVVPVSGHLKSAYAVTNTVVTTGDSTILVKTPDGTAGTIVIAQSGSAVGTVDTTAAAVVNTEVLAGETIEFENDATPDAGAASYSAVIEPGGLVVAGVSSAATATTGDVRGTYDPLAVMDGATEITLLVLDPDPEYLGVDQYAG